MGELANIVNIFEIIMMFVVLVIIIGGRWAVYEKAGQSGWAALIPIYSEYILFKLAGKPWWWLIMIFVPVVNLVILVVAYIEAARRFGKGAAFGIGLLVLPIIFFPIIGFGKADYLFTEDFGKARSRA